MKPQIKLLIALCLVLFPILIVSQCSAHVSDLKIEVDPFQCENSVLKEWSSDMKKLDITTKERGLTYRITVTNVVDEPVTVDKLTIQVSVTKIGKISGFFKEINTYINLQPNEKDYFNVTVDFGNSQDILGSYVTEIQRVEGISKTYDLEAYPSEFKVVSEDQFEKEIEDKVDALFSFGDVYITVELVSIGIVITLIGGGI